eukprot:1193467-Prorocentrum_minimum.AAC.5
MGSYLQLDDYHLRTAIGWFGVLRTPTLLNATPVFVIAYIAKSILSQSGADTNPVRAGAAWPKQASSNHMFWEVKQEEEG